MTQKQVSKNEKAVNLANKRVPKAIKAINLVANLASANYYLTNEQKQEIITAISDAVVEMTNKLENVRIAQTTFRLNPAN